MVATPALRSQFGARLASVYAPAVIASFGSGAARIDIRAVAADGTAAYDSALAADRSARIAAGEELIGNHRIVMTAAAATVLRAGQVDPRLLAMLAALAAQQPLRILAFGDPSPGASAAIPLRSVETGPGRRRDPGRSPAADNALVPAGAAAAVPAGGTSFTSPR